MITTPDLERILPALIFSALSHAWPGLYVSRARPHDPRDYVVTVQRSGGSPKSAVLDQVRIAVNTWAPTEVEANDLAEQVRGVIEAQRGHAPIIRAEASGPSAINAKAEPPQRFFYADIITRRSSSG